MMLRSKSIARAAVGAGRPHERLRFRRGEVAADAELQRS